jgi:hypothetical protein
MLLFVILGLILVQIIRVFELFDMVLLLIIVAAESHSIEIGVILLLLLITLCKIPNFLNFRQELQNRLSH